MDKQQYEQFQQIIDGAPIPLPAPAEPAMHPYDARVLAEAAEQRAFQRTFQEDLRQDAYGSDAWRALRRLEKSAVDAFDESDDTFAESDDLIEAAAYTAYAELAELTGYTDLYEPEEFEGFMTEFVNSGAGVLSADQPMQEAGDAMIAEPAGYEDMDMEGDGDFVELAQWESEPLHPVVPIPDRGLAARDAMMTEPAGMTFTHAEYVAFAEELEAAERAAQADLAGHIEVGERVEGTDYPQFAEFVDLAMFDDDDEPAMPTAANAANSANAVSNMPTMTLDHRVFEFADEEQDYSQQFVDVDMADMMHLDLIDPLLLKADLINPSLLETDTIDPLLLDMLDHQIHLAGHQVYPPASTLANGPNRTATEMDGGAETSESETSESETESEPETEPKLKRGRGSRAATKSRAAPKAPATTKAPAAPKPRAPAAKMDGGAETEPKLKRGRGSRAATKASAATKAPAAPKTRAATKAPAAPKAPAVPKTRAAPKSRR
jgi:hypothetical protein